MRVVVKSLLSLSLFCSIAWAEPAPQTTTVPAQPDTIIPTPAQVAPKPGILSAVAGANAIVQAQPQEKEAKALTAEQIAKEKISQEVKVKALVKDQATRLQQLEKANLDALAQNQELQLKNDSLGVQVQVLQSEASAQMFIYGAATIAVGVLLGFFIASYIYTKRRRQW